MCWLRAVCCEYLALIAALLRLFFSHYVHLYPIDHRTTDLSQQHHEETARQEHSSQQRCMNHSKTRVRLALASYLAHADTAQLNKLLQSLVLISWACAQQHHQSLNPNHSQHDKQGYFPTLVQTLRQLDRTRMIPVLTEMTQQGSQHRGNSVWPAFAVIKLHIHCHLQEHGQRTRSALYSRSDALDFAVRGSARPLGTITWPTFGAHCRMRGLLILLYLHVATEVIRLFC